MENHNDAADIDRRLVEEINILKLEGALFCFDPKEAKRRKGKLTLSDARKQPVTIFINPLFGQPAVLAYKVTQAIFLKISETGAARIADLAAGGYIARAEPVLLIGEAGTGKTHLASGLCVAACEQCRRVRFTTATALVNELVEARASNALSRALGRWERIELIGIDELGYVPLAEIGAELLFQVIADRAERAAVIVTTNLPFSEWGQVFPNPRLCQALVDRLTDRAHIIETGSESFRFRRTLAGTRGIT